MSWVLCVVVGFCVVSTDFTYPTEKCAVFTDFSVNKNCLSVFTKSVQFLFKQKLHAPYVRFYIQNRVCFSLKTRTYGYGFQFF